MDYVEFILYQGFIVSTVGIVFYLAAFRTKILFFCVIGVSFLMMLPRFFGGQESLFQHHWMGDIKLLLLLPFGLGAVLGFGLLTQETQEKHLFAFNMFINGAVIVNIAAMMFVPGDEAPLRVLVMRIACALLVLWLVQGMKRKNWKTVCYDNGFFLFSGVSMFWVLCHAFYRIGLVSLPIFNTPHFFLFEPLSLGGMYLLYRLHGRRHPLSHYFGYSDTLVAATMALCAKAYPVEGFKVTQKYHLYQNDFDWVLLEIHGTVIFFALSFIIINFRVKPAEGF